ncbi:hypothetical protein GCM10028793_41030 [Nocardiopsis oceani]
MGKHARKSPGRLRPEGAVAYYLPSESTDGPPPRRPLRVDGCVLCLSRDSGREESWSVTPGSRGAPDRIRYRASRATVPPGRGGVHGAQWTTRSRNSLIETLVGIPTAPEVSSS